jgi:hypothetical protein
MVRRIETGDHLACLDRRTDVDQALDDLAADAEAERGFDTGNDRAGTTGSLMAVVRKAWAFQVRAATVAPAAAITPTESRTCFTGSLGRRMAALPSEV